MGFFRRGTPMDASHLEKLDRELQAMKQSLERHRPEAAEPRSAPAAGLDAFAMRIGQVAAQFDELDTKLAAQTSSQAELDTKLAELDAKQAELDAKQARFDARQAELDAAMADLAARVTSVATELTNQITELGHDIDALGAADQARAGAVDEAVLGDIRDGQVRLAAEQARYQIAFRQDLAQLAERLRRPGS